MTHHFMIQNEVSFDNEHHVHQGTFESIQKMRNFLCERKYDNDDRSYMSDTFDYIKQIKWHFDIEE